MRTWLFYKVVEKDPTVVEFRRADYGGIHNGVPPRMAGQVVFEGRNNIESAVKRLVKECGWVGEPPMEASHPVASAVLKGRW